MVATVDRRDELARLLATIARQTHREVEIVIVDQNASGWLDPVIQPHADSLNVQHLRSTRGVSRARNVGMRVANGELLGFPDDDCWYSPELLETVDGWFRVHPEYDGVVGRGIGPRGEPVFGQRGTRGGDLTRFNVWKRVNANTLFLRHATIGVVGDWDEALGLGAGTPWGAAEDMDYALRALACGFRLYYEPAISVFHPVDESSDREGIDKAYRYSLGMGYALRKHRYPPWFVAYAVMGPLKPWLASAGRGKVADARFFRALCVGRLRGWLRRPGGVARPRP